MVTPVITIANDAPFFAGKSVSFDAHSFEIPGVVGGIAETELAGNEFDASVTLTLLPNDELVEKIEIKEVIKYLPVELQDLQEEQHLPVILDELAALELSKPITISAKLTFVKS